MEKKAYIAPITSIMTLSVQENVMVVSGPNISTNPADKVTPVDTKTAGDWSDIWTSK